MEKTINKITININKLKVLLPILSLIVLLFNINIWVGIFLTVFLSIAILFLDVRNMLCVYIFLSFFDEILICDKISGSISRIILVLILIKLVYKIIKENIKPNWKDVFSTLFVLLSLLVGWLTLKVDIESITTMGTILSFIIFSIVLEKEENTDKTFGVLLTTIVVAVTISILYGLIFNNFMICISNHEVVLRFKGTYEPNFMALFINLGIISLFGIKKDINKYLYIALLSIFFMSIFLTISITGLIVCGIILLLYVAFNRKEYKEILIILITSGIIGILISLGTTYIFKNINHKTEVSKETIEKQDGKPNNVEFEPQNVINNENDWLKRFDKMNEILANGDLDTLTSGRLPLIREFIMASFNRDIVNILLGNGPATKKIFSRYFNSYKYSHNTYIDLFYNFGIIGSIIILIYIGNIFIKNNYFGIKLINSNYSKSLKLLRICILIFAMALSLYTKRMILVFFLL